LPPSSAREISGIELKKKEKRREEKKRKGL
jgi:hypothetical protein